MPKNVAVKNAQDVLRVCVSTGAVTVGSVVMRAFASASASPAKVFKHLGVENRRADLISARGPFAEIDLAATVAAKREIFSLGLDQCATGRTAEELRGFFSGSHRFGSAAGCAVKTYIIVPKRGHARCRFYMRLRRATRRCIASRRALTLAGLVLPGSSPMRIKPCPEPA